MFQDFCRKGRQSSSGGCQLVILQKKSEKLHEIKKILAGGPTPLDPPMQSLKILTDNYDKNICEPVRAALQRFEGCSLFAVSIKRFHQFSLNTL